MMDKEKVIQAGKIAKEVREWIKPQVKKGVKLLEIAEKIEGKIIELGGRPAFPTNLSINNIAAHYTPSHEDETVAEGLLKIDFGVHVGGWAADNAFSVDLEGTDENKKLVEASEKALDSALKLVKSGASTDDVGENISKEIESFGFSPVINLCGHQMEEYELHTGISIPNVNDGKDIKIKEGLYAVEPFATSGSGRVKDGRGSGIYELISSKNVRSPIAREILDFIEDEYNTLPFCSRWLVKKFGTKAFLGLNQLEENGNLHQFDQLVETQSSKVSQAEHTILVEKDGVKIVTA